MGEKGRVYFLNLTSYQVISTHESKIGEPPSGLIFNKFMSLAHHNLKNKGVDIRLPHCWYRFGDEVVRYHMPPQVVWDHETPTKTHVKWTHEPPEYDPNAKYEKIIIKTVEGICEKYCQNVETVIQKVYAFAPFQFQRDFLELRETLYGINNAFNWDFKSYVTLSKPILEKVLTNFPVKKFPDLRGELDIVKEYQTYALVDIERNLDNFHDIVNSFWFLFCYYLRAHRLGNENVPRETIAHWKARIPFEKERYNRIIGDILIDASEKDKRIFETKILKETIEWRNRDIKETQELIDMFSDDLKGLKDIKIKYHRDT